MDPLARFVDDEQVFHRTLWRRTPAVLHPRTPPMETLTVAELDRILDAGLLTTPYATLVREDGPVPEERYCFPRVVQGGIDNRYVDAGAVRRLIGEEGAVLLLRYVDQWHAGVRELADGLAECFQRQVEAFFFLTPPGTRGRPVHRVDADVLAVQIHGSERWRVYPGPLDGNWQPERVDGDPGDPLLDVVLRQGEVLYVPRGFAYAAEATGGSASAHLSFTVHEAGSAHLYAVLEALLMDGDGLPARPNDDAALSGAASDLIAHCRRTLAGLTPEELVHLARGAMRREQHPVGGTLSALLD
ncbi:cupin domain-containing protein [Streptomyces sp. SR27]|uniref:JmjC domain-containing protein n=1 Tax=Streptomyces sp. SR27 TaxID=3076630 RepID=UPI00295B9945|nr:cupin domain-containing protein [Streptomyces sp. SR27]MDV9186957.1 cupin domain-containing protein [Streptomyces sp. SR27]